MSMIKANDFFFLSGIDDHVVCSIEQAGSMTILRFADEADQDYVISVIVKLQGYNFILHGDHLESVTVTRSAVLDVIQAHINSVFSLDS